MGDAYPEIREAQSRVAETVKLEEERFAETLDLGMAKIREYIERAPTAHAAGPVRPVSTASSCSRSTTPTDSRRTSPRRCSRTPAGGAAGEPGRLRGGDGGAARARARRRDRSAPPATAAGDGVGHLSAALRRAAASPSFLGYTELAAPARILALVDGGPPRAARRARARPSRSSSTGRPAYAESGGQMGDTGTVDRPRRAGARSTTRTTAAPSSSSTASR